MIKYRVNFGWKNDIDAFEVVRETDKQLVYVSEWNGRKRENRVAKRSSSDMWFDTWEEAHEFLLENMQQKIEGARRQIERLKGDEERIRGMKKP